jgi:hypothetical protein
MPSGTVFIIFIIFIIFTVFIIFITITIFTIFIDSIGFGWRDEEGRADHLRGASC